MKKVLIFGAGATGTRIYQDIREGYEVVGFVDNSSEKWGGALKTFR